MSPIISRLGFSKGFGRRLGSLLPTYSVTPSTSSVNEGSSVTFTVTTTNVPSGTTLYWSTNTVSGTVNSSDFNDAATTGSFTITNNTGSVVRTLANDATTEGSESFQLQIRTDSVSGTIVATSSTVTIGDTSLTPTYSVSPSTTSVNEGSSVTFTTSTTNVSDGTTLYWTLSTVSGVINSSDFVGGATSGSFTITSNSGSVVLNLANDSTTEGSESFQFQVRTASISGTVVATSTTVTINDTSQPTSPFSATYLVVAGGGGGANFSGGGGAGGFKTSTISLLTFTSYTLTVGAGGAGGPGSTPGIPGNNSVFSTITSTGGGGGGQRNPGAGNNGAPGGSGGGASGWDSPPSGVGGSGIPGEGFPGGNTPGPPGWGGAGGGGAGGAGSNGSSNNGGPGGPGSPSSITGSSVFYAGGGGGGSYNLQPSGSGGNGGGGTGANGGAGDPTPPASNGVANTGGGGGGGQTTSGGIGGSGIVILRYPNARTISNPGGGLTYATSPVGSDTVASFTSGTGNVSWS